MALLGIYLKRETFRSLWGVLHLLPAPMGVYPGTRPTDNPPWRSAESQNVFYDHPCANFDLYNADAWKIDLNDLQLKGLQTILDAAKEFHTRLHQWHLTLSGDQRSRMLIIAGVGYKTLFRLEHNSGFAGTWESMKKITDRGIGDPHREGDGRVPLASASLDNVAVRYVKGVHGGLTNIPDVYRDVFRWLNDQPLELPDSVKKALAEHLSQGNTSEAPSLDGTVGAKGDDPGYWNLSEPDSEALSQLDKKLDSGEMPSFHRVRLL